MPDPNCKFIRNDTMWVMIDDCEGGTKECPPIPNSRALSGGAARHPDQEPAFLASFRTALGDNTFTFANANELILDCEGSAVSTPKTLKYYRNGTLFKEFKYLPGSPPTVELATS